MSLKQPPKTADRDLTELRRTLQDQRAAKTNALLRVKQTSLRAVECYDTPTTYLDPKILKDRLAKGEEEGEEEESPSEK